MGNFNLFTYQEFMLPGDTGRSERFYILQRFTAIYAVAWQASTEGELKFLVKGNHILVSSLCAKMEGTGFTSVELMRHSQLRPGCILLRLIQRLTYVIDCKDKAALLTFLVGIHLLIQYDMTAMQQDEPETLCVHAIYGNSKDTL